MVLSDDIKGLLESGVHFGHLGKHWNPKMKAFIFGKKKNVYIIDLEKTAQKVEEAKDFLKQISRSGKRILFVSTKKQLRSTIRELATSCGMPYVVERWVGGLLTNFSTVRRRINKYLELLEQREKGEFGGMTKKEVVKLNREIERMEKIYSGVKTLEDIPDCLFLVDPKKENACVREANKLSIPIVALIDTDANPEVIDYPIPGNDDSIKSVKYVTSKLVEAINEELTNVKEEAQDLLNKKSADDESDKEEENPAEDKDQKKSTRKNKQKKVDHSS